MQRETCCRLKPIFNRLKFPPTTKGIKGEKALKTEVIMKNKVNLKKKTTLFENPMPKTKPMSIRPMRSLVAVRSLKPKTAVATLLTQPQMAEVSKQD
jgi:hypothetical protein